MVDRLSTQDTSFLSLEDGLTPMHVGQVLICQQPPNKLGSDAIVAKIGARLDALPRYRQRVRYVPGWLANPVWVDDDNFELDYHVRRSALPSPGSDEQLSEFVARVSARPLDLSRPLWEVYVVEDLQRDRFAVITKTHQSLVDTAHALDIAGILLDEGVLEDNETPTSWTPRPAPNGASLMADAVLDNLRRPGQVIDTVRSGFGDLRETGRRVLRVGGTVLRASASPAHDSPFQAPVGTARRFVMVSSDLADYREVRRALGDADAVTSVTVNDVALATITGALRNWHQMRGDHVRTGASVRAMVPVTVADEHEPSGRRVQAAFVDLPIGENSPGMRLRQISFAMRQQMEVGKAVGADTLAGLSGFAPPAMHSLGARLGSAMTRRLFNLVITNVPGPQRVLYAGEAPLVATYPVMPLARGQALAIGMTSYNGKIYYGINADRDALPDVDLLGEALAEALEELLESGAAGNVR